MLRLLSKCLGRSTPSLSEAPQPSDSHFDSFRWAPFSVALDLCLAKLLHYGTNVIQKLTISFKNHMRNLNNFRQTVVSPKS